MADRHNRDIDRQPAPLPEPLNVKCVDAHAHMEIVTNTAADSPEVGAVIAEAKSVGIDRIVQVGYSAEQSEWCVKAAESWPNVLAAVALHPNEAPVVEEAPAPVKKPRKPRAPKVEAEASAITAKPKKAKAASDKPKAPRKPKITIAK